MSTSLDVSLDSLIEAKVRSARVGGRGGGRGDRRNSGGRGNFKAESTNFSKPRQSAPYKVQAPVTNARVAAYTGGAQVRRADQVSQLRQPFQKNDAPVRQQQAERREKAPQPLTSTSTSSASGSSIFDRLGNGSGLSSGTSVTIQKLNKDIVPSDISDLCLTIGEVKSVSMQYDNAGQSTGRAEVTFSKRSDAVSCVQRFHNVALDGTPMHVQLTGEPAGAVSQESVAVPSLPSNSFSFSAPRESASAPSNVREGLFGTAFGGNQSGGGQKERKAARDPSFSVTMRGSGDAIVQPRGPSKRKDEHDDRGDNAMPQGTASTYNKGGNGGGGRGQGRGGGRREGGRGGGRGGRGGGVEMKESDLDSAMDAYMSNK